MTRPGTAPTRGLPLHEHLREHARRAPERTAIVFSGRRFDYGWLDRASDALAAALADRGVAKGDTVALFLQNSPQFIVSSLAIQKLGAVVGPCNPMFKEWELAYQLNDLGARILITTDDLAPVFAGIEEPTAVEHLICSAYEDVLPDDASGFAGPLGVPPAAGAERWAELIDGSRPAPTAPPIEMAEDPALVIYTSGTTGQPKGAQLSFGNVEFKTACVCATYGFAAEDVFLSAMPVFHIAGMLFGMNSPIMAGATIVLLNRFEASEALRLIRDERVTVTYLTPPMLEPMMRTELFEPSSFPALRVSAGTSFGAQIDQTLSDRWRQAAGVPLFEFAYGMSETHTADTMTSPDDIRYGTVGKPTFQTEIRICDLDDRSADAAPGELGEIAVRGPGVFLGYRGRDEATAAVLEDGWYYSGDIGRFDEDGFLRFEGRRKEMIKSSGYSVFPEEVEGMMLRHPGIAQVAVVGYADPVRGESVRAFVVPAPGAVLEEDAVIAWSRERMAAYKYPRSVRVVSEIPSTTTGKMLRLKLKEMA